ncbi:MAG: DNA alkylation repair protein [Chloroflexota bacterium]
MMISDMAVYEELRALGKEQYRKIWKNHGVQGESFGVSFADMKVLVKKIKTNHQLSLDLWATGNHDARVLATMIADPKQATDAMLDAWARDLSSYVITDAFSTYASKTTLARAKIEEWTQSDDEFVGQAGWSLLAQLARDDKTLPDSYFEPFLERITRDLHSSKNRVRHSMNNAVIAIGLRNNALEAKATAVAQKIGKVVVDHGQTDCKTPDAIAYMEKAKARKK